MMKGTTIDSGGDLTLDFDKKQFGKMIRVEGVLKRVNIGPWHNVKVLTAFIYYIDVTKVEQIKKIKSPWVVIKKDQKKLERP